jgi:hypothetical protein
MNEVVSSLGLPGRHHVCHTGIAVLTIPKDDPMPPSGITGRGLL